jgi:hypothetical protein
MTGTGNNTYVIASNRQAQVRANPVDLQRKDQRLASLEKENQPPVEVTKAGRPGGMPSSCCGGSHGLTNGFWRV